MSEWFFTKDGQQQGPVAAETLRELASSGKLLEDDLVWQDGLVDWVAAKSIKRLLPTSHPISTVSSGVSASPVAAVPHEPIASTPIPNRTGIPAEHGIGPTINKRLIIKIIGGVVTCSLLVSIIVRGCGLLDGNVEGTTSTSNQETVAHINPDRSHGHTPDTVANSSPAPMLNTTEKPGPGKFSPSANHTQATSSSFQVPKGAILILTFDQATVSTEDRILHVRDLSQRGLTGDVHDGSLTQGKVRDGLLCGGRTYLEIDGSFPTAAQPRTLAAWIKKAEGQWKKKHVITYGKNWKNRVFGIMYASDKWRFYDNFGGMDTGMPVDEAWHHHCVVYDGTTLTYYLDSKSVVSGPKTLDTDIGPFVVGACADRTVHFVGIIDEVALFDRALSTEEVSQIYQMGVDGTSLSPGPATGIENKP